MKQLAAPLLLFALAAVAADSTRSNSMLVMRGGQQSGVAGAAEFFTGAVRIESQFQGSDPSRLSGGMVTFEPGARSAWHTHPLGQVLIVTSGTGLVQQWGEPIQEMRQGDVVWTLPGIKHWHGATPTNQMTHIAIQERLAEKNVEWLEKVSDEQYEGRR